MTGAVATDRGTTGSPSSQRGGADTSVATAPELQLAPLTPVPDRQIGLQAVFDEWQKQHANTPGFRRGTSAAPGTYQDYREVSSWLQVPEILKMLNEKPDANVRLTFPASATTDSEKIRQEQSEIRDFIRANHGKPLAEVLGSLESKIENSFTFSTNRGSFPEGFTAGQWIQAAQLGARPATSTQSVLNVTDIVALDASKLQKQATKDDIAVALSHAVSDARPVAFTIPKTYTTCHSFAQTLLKHTEAGGALSTTALEQLSHVKIWVGPSTGFGQTHSPGESCGTVQPYSVSEFIDKFKNPPPPQEKKTAPETVRAEPVPDLNVATSRIKTQYDFVSLKSELQSLTPDERAQITAYLAFDPDLSFARKRVSTSNPNLSANPLSAETADAISALHSASFTSEKSKAFVKTLTDFYHGYLRPFPNPAEVESLKAIFDVLSSNPSWDVEVAKDQSTGRVLGACSGQVIKVPTSTGGEVGVAWNEHTWVDKETRQSGLGKELAANFKKRAAAAGAIGVVIETDNPYLIETNNSTDGFNHNDSAARKKYWTEVKGEAMDPFNRFTFWGKQGFGVVTAQNGVPAPYEQISLDLGNQESCKTLNLAFNPISEEYRDSLPKQLYMDLFRKLQESIDPHAKYHPDFVRTMKQIDELPGDSLRFVSLNSDEARTVMAKGRPHKAKAEEDDIRYCQDALAQGKLSDEEKEILTKTLRHYNTKTA